MDVGIGGRAGGNVEGEVVGACIEGVIGGHTETRDGYRWSRGVVTPRFNMSMMLDLQSNTPQLYDIKDHKIEPP